MTGAAHDARQAGRCTLVLTGRERHDMSITDTQERAQQFLGHEAAERIRAHKGPIWAHLVAEDGSRHAVQLRKMSALDLFDGHGMLAWALDVRQNSAFDLSDVDLTIVHRRDQRSAA